MYNEVLIEEGIVISTEKGFAEISLTKNKNCSDCSAKIICKPGDSESQIIKVSDPYGTFPGDVVKISINGSEIVKSTFWLYGLPLMLLLITVLVMNIFMKGVRLIELFSFLTGMVVISFYYLIFFYIKPSHPKLMIPKIISFTRQIS